MNWDGEEFGITEYDKARLADRKQEILVNYKRESMMENIRRDVAQPTPRTRAIDQEIHSDPNIQPSAKQQKYRLLCKKLERELTEANKSILFYIEEWAHYKQVAERRGELLRRVQDELILGDPLESDIAKEIS